MADEDYDEVLMLIKKLYNSVPFDTHPYDPQHARDFKSDADGFDLYKHEHARF